jgi:xylulokinase
MRNNGGRRSAPPPSGSLSARICLGALRPGYAYSISGTTEVLEMISDAPALSEGLMSVDWRGVH